MSSFYTPDSIVVKAGVAHFPDAPQSVFYHHHNPDLVFFESNATETGSHEIEVMKAILELARELKTPRIYTAAAIPQAVSHSDASRLLYAGNSERVVGSLEKYGMETMSEGVISGANGLLLGFAAAQGIEAVCLLATIPAYAAALTYHDGALAIVNAFEKIIEVSVDTGEMEQDIKISEPVYEEIEDKLKAFFSGASDSENGVKRVEHKDIPKVVMDRIERLFAAARKDKQRARELKEELDKWDLYKLYEDRFLDLFENDEEM